MKNWEALLTQFFFFINDIKNLLSFVDGLIAKLPHLKANNIIRY